MPSGVWRCVRLHKVLDLALVVLGVEDCTAGGSRDGAQDRGRQADDQRVG